MAIPVLRLAAPAPACFHRRMSDPTPPSPLGTPEPWELVSDAYLAEVTPMFEAFARDAMRAIGAVSPAEISLSILGQITQVLHTPAAEKAA